MPVSARKPLKWACGRKAIMLIDTPLVMGILNVTTDSFSDGGRFINTSAAIKHGVQMAGEGADILDVGGESTRPGSAGVSLKEELRRVIPVISKLRSETDALISIDTRKSEVAKAALDAGADIINDVSAMTADPAMAEVVAGSEAGVILMHMKGTPADMQKDPSYRNVVREVVAYLKARLAASAKHGIDRERIAIDPGLGFGKNTEHNLKLITALGTIRTLRRPVVIGISRKRTIGAITGRESDDRMAGSLAAHAYCAMNGADILRVHDVRETVDAIKVLIAIREAK